MPQEEALLRLTGLCAGYGPRRVLHDITLDVAPREIVALVGANGAGKSTLLRTVFGLLPATRGGLALAGTPLASLTPSQRVRLGLSFSPEGRLVCPDLSVTDNVWLGAYASRLSRKQSAQRLAQLFEWFAPLRPRSSQLAGTLSGGEQQMVAMARALMANPRLLLLDEPTLGLSPAMVERIFALITSLRDQGVAVLMAEQQAAAALSIAQTGYVLAAGMLVQSGPASTLASDPAVRHAFLGGA